MTEIDSPIQAADADAGVVVDRVSFGRQLASAGRKKAVRRPNGHGAGQRITVLVVDDHALFRAGMQQLLENHPRVSVVGVAQDGHEAVDLAVKFKPDVITLDVTMPGLNGLDAADLMRSKGVQARLLFVSMHAEPSLVRRLLREGASGYVLKGSAPEDLLRGIVALADDETYLCPKAVGLVMGRNSGHEEATLDSLSPRERQVLQQIAEGCSSKDIGKKLSLSVKTIETHRARLMRKLDLHSIAALTKFALREGITQLDA